MHVAGDREAVGEASDEPCRVDRAADVEVSEWILDVGVGERIASGRGDRDRTDGGERDADWEITWRCRGAVGRGESQVKIEIVETSRHGEATGRGGKVMSLDGLKTGREGRRHG